MKRRDLIAAAAGALATTALAGSVAWAAIPGDGNVYSACMRKDTGTVRLIDKSLPPTNSMSKCKPFTETEISWNQQGPQGNPGEPGAAGAPGPAGAQGDKGDKGDPGQNGADGAPGSPGMAFHGAWSARQYAHDDIVSHNGSLWIGVLNPPPLEEPGESGHWNLLVAKGADGAPGQAGPQGPKGDKGDRGEAGPAGPPGASGAPLWGRFNGDGSRAAGNGPTAQKVSGTHGLYYVDFPRDVSSCALLTTTLAGVAGHVSSVSSNSGSHRVTVSTFRDWDSVLRSPGNEDVPFSIVAFC